MEFLGLTTIGWVAISISISMSVLAGMMLMLGQERTHYVWGIFCIAIAIWSAAFYFVTIADSVEDARFWWKIAYIGIILNPFTFFHFTLEFVNNRHLNIHKTLIVTLLYVFAFILVGINLTTNLIVDKVTFLFDELYYNTPPAVLHPYFLFFFLGLVIYSLYLVLRAYKDRSEDKLFRQRVPYFFIATLLGFVGGSMNFLAVYEIQVPPVTNFSVAAGAAIIAYAILRYRLFNARVVTAQFLTFVLAAFAFVRLVVADSFQWVIFNILLFVATLFVGFNLIKSVRREVEQREELEALSQQLSEANSKLKELDRLKSEFLSFASHQVKAPMAVVKGYASLIADGTLGDASDKVKETAEKIKSSADNMVGIVNNLLSLRKIEEGKMDYYFERVDVIPVVLELVEELKPLVEKKSLGLNIDSKIQNAYVNADIQKLRQVYQNLIENAVKYTEQGWIKITIEEKDKNVLVSVSDSGHGISEELLPHLFEEYSRDKTEVKIEGTGLGLYIAKQIVLAHKGKIWAESAGEGEGSAFFVEIPMV